jgi:hypothetical protein
VTIAKDRELPIAAAAGSPVHRSKPTKLGASVPRWEKLDCWYAIPAIVSFLRNVAMMSEEVEERGVCGGKLELVAR